MHRGMTRMAIDATRLRARSFAPRVHRYSRRDFMLCAFGVGFGQGPTYKTQPLYVYEDADGTALMAVPKMANVLACPGFWARDAGTGIDWSRVVHAQQSLVLHAPGQAEGEVMGQTRVIGRWDKESGKWALMRSLLAYNRRGLCSMRVRSTRAPTWTIPSP